MTGTADSKLDYVPVENATSEDIPAGGLMRVTGVNPATGAFIVAKPDQDSQESLLVAGPFTIPAQESDSTSTRPGKGIGTFSNRVMVAFDPEIGGDPDIGDSLGSVSGSWYAGVGNGGFSCIFASSPWASCVRKAPNGDIPGTFITVAFPFSSSPGLASSPGAYQDASNLVFNFPDVGDYWVTYRVYGRLLITAIGGGGVPGRIETVLVRRSSGGSFLSTVEGSEAWVAEAEVINVDCFGEATVGVFIHVTDVTNGYMIQARCTTGPTYSYAIIGTGFSAATTRVNYIRLTNVPGSGGGPIGPPGPTGPPGDPTTLLGTANVFTADQTFNTNISVGGVISGNGSGITALSASALSTGTVPDARIGSATRAGIAAQSAALGGYIN